MHVIYDENQTTIKVSISEKMNNKQCKLQIYGTNGNMLKQIILKGDESSFNISDIGHGTYIAQLIIEGKQKETTKVIVK